MSPKLANNFHCILCDYKCSKQSDYNKHLITRKHQILTKYSGKVAENNDFQCECGKVYKWQESLLYHRRVHKSSENTEEKRHTEDELHTAGERNTEEEIRAEKEIHTEEEKNNKEEKHTEKTRKSVKKRNNQEQRKAEEDNYIKERKLSQDEKIKCFTCGVFSDNSKLYQKHLSSQMHKAFSMIIDLT